MTRIKTLFLVVLTTFLFFTCKTAKETVTVLTVYKFDTIDVEKYIKDTVEIQKLIAEKRVLQIANKEIAKKLKTAKGKVVTKIVYRGDYNAPVNNLKCDTVSGDIYMDNIVKKIGKIKGVKIKPRFKNNNNKKEKVVVKKTSWTYTIILSIIMLIVGYIMAKKKIF